MRMTITCAILGDSLAAGVAAFQPDCLSDTKIGISSAAYLRAHTISISAETVLISLGVNDSGADTGTTDRLAGLRLRIKVTRVFWILPARPETTRRIIRDIAQAFGDRLIETRGYTGSDGLHLSPSTYRAIASVFDLFGARRSQAAPANRGNDKMARR
jgi:lysophospholipase L1-like esterase